jgi:hypothetical protein
MYIHCPGSNKVIHSYFTHRTLHSTEKVSQSNNVAALYKKRAIWARLRNGVAGSHPVRRMDIHIHTYIYIYIYIYTHTHRPICTHTNTYIRTYLYTYIHTHIHTNKNTYIHTFTRIRSPTNSLHEVQSLRT